MQSKIEFVREKIQAERPTISSFNVSLPTSWLDGTVRHAELEQEGFRLLAENKVAVLMLAGGLATRMEMGGLRGNMPIGPITGRSIFRLQGEKIAAIQQRYTPKMPWLVMTSQEVHKATIASFQAERYFGVAPERVWFFQQSSLPILDAEGNAIILPDGKCLQSPAGHGGMLGALGASGILTRLLEEDIEYLFHFQHPNVLEKVCDPVALGYHSAGQYNTTTKAILEHDSEEKMGICLQVDDCLRVVEYYYRDESLPSNLWQKAPASIATHIWSVSFLQSCLENGVDLPYHKVPHGCSADAAQPLQKIEQFIFDLLAYSNANALMIVAREEEYAPVKGVKGIYSIEAARAALTRLYSRWLLQAGATFQGSPEECLVEISPLFALSAEELRTKIPAGLFLRGRTVL